MVKGFKGIIRGMGNRGILNRPIVFVFSLFFVFSFIIVVSKFVGSIPRPATEFYGFVTINDSAAPIGVNITAYDPDNSLCGYFVVVNSGYYGFLSCNGDESSTAIDEGAEDYEEISFFVNGSRAVAFGNVSWVPGVFRFVNLSVKNYAPFFLHNLTVQYIDEGSTLIYDVNCSDLNIDDNLTYYDNTTRFDIDLITGLINWTPVNADVGNHSILITCSDGLLNTSDILLIVVSDINNPPVLEPIGPLIAVTDEPFFYDVNATDADNDTLTYSTNSTLFEIDEYTGIISFTPSVSQVGNYSINISVSDGLLADYEVISFTIVRGPYCGDGVCGNGETCLSCPQDCGSCPVAPSEGVLEEEAEVGAPSVERVRRIISFCEEKWVCSEWSPCTPEGIQTRKCVDLNRCGTKRKKPPEIRSCEYIGTCSDGIKNCHDGSCEEGVDCGGPCAPCPKPASCFDGIKNCHDGSCEEGVDCGGPCAPCELRKYAKAPLPRLAPIAKKFPWLLLLLVIMLISSVFVGDRTYVRRISQKEFEEYRKKLKHYKKIRKKIYTISFVLSLIGLCYIFYIYLMSDKPELMERFFWLPLAIVIALLVLSYFIIGHFRYYEYRKRKKEEEFILEHKRKKRSLLKLEDTILISLELKALKKINVFLKEDLSKEAKRLIMDVVKILEYLVKRRKKKFEPFVLTDDIMAIINKIFEEKLIIELSKKYIEFRAVLDALRGLIKISARSDGSELESEDRIKRFERFVLAIANISRDRHIIAVIKSNKEFVKLYNSLVDVYDYCKKRLELDSSLERDIREKEKLFLKSIESITKSPEIMRKIEQKKAYILAYNSLVDLYNHYQKREEIAKELREF